MRLIDADKVVEQLEKLREEDVCKGKKCALCKYHSGCYYYKYEDQKLAIDRAIEIVELAEGNGWIPVSERGPESEESVIVILKHTYESNYVEYSIARYLELSDGIKYWCDNKYGYLEHARYTDGNGGSSAYKVAAWKPIEPYKRKEDK